MFFFKKKTATKRLDDKVRTTKPFKYKGIAEQVQTANSAGDYSLIICFFQQSVDEIKNTFSSKSLNFKTIDYVGNAGDIHAFAEYKTFLLSAEVVLNSQEIKYFLQKHKEFNIQVFIAEHYPMLSHEKRVTDLLDSLIDLKLNYCFFSALDEPLFKVFGGERITAVIEKLGMKEDETISHSMITKSIQNAQEKIEKQVNLERKANSAEEWFRMNRTEM